MGWNTLFKKEYSFQWASSELSRSIKDARIQKHHYSIVNSEFNEIRRKKTLRMHFDGSITCPCLNLPKVLSDIDKSGIVLQVEVVDCILDRVALCGLVNFLNRWGYPFLSYLPNEISNFVGMTASVGIRIKWRVAKQVSKSSSSSVAAFVFRHAVNDTECAYIFERNSR
jgi:hypothetical protein